MTKKVVIVFGIIIFILLVVVAILRAVGEDSWICQNNQWVKHGNPTSAMPTTPCGTNQNTNATNQPLNTNQPTASESGNIIVDEPLADSVLAKPFTISGQARVFENQFQYRLIDDTEAILAQGTITATGSDPSQLSPFSVSVEYQTPASDEGTLEVFDLSAMDGSETDLVSLPVRLLTADMSVIKVYLPKTVTTETSCATVYPFDRTIPKTETIAQAAITALLAGPTAEETSTGYTSLIPDGVQLNSLSIQNGVARADFNETLNEGSAGSCRVTTIRAQITQTLKQFSTVQDVVISVNGNVDTTLQP